MGTQIRRDSKSDMAASSEETTAFAIVEQMGGGLDASVRIDQVLDLLRKAWMRSPDLRLGQLIVNTVGPLGSLPGNILHRRFCAGRLLKCMANWRDDDDAAEKPMDKPPRFTHRQGQFLAFIHAYHRSTARARPRPTSAIVCSFFSSAGVIFVWLGPVKFLKLQEPPSPLGAEWMSG